MKKSMIVVVVVVAVMLMATSAFAGGGWGFIIPLPSLPFPAIVEYDHHDHRSYGYRDHAVGMHSGYRHIDRWQDKANKQEARRDGRHDGYFGTRSDDWEDTPYSRNYHAGLREGNEMYEREVQRMHERREYSHDSRGTTGRDWVKREPVHEVRGLPEPPVREELSDEDRKELKKRFDGGEWED